MQAKNQRKKTEEQPDKETDEQPDTTDMPDLESEESAEQKRNQRGVGLKILISDQMINRLPITLAQLKAGSNSENFKKMK